MFVVQLQHLVTDEICLRITDLHQSEKRNGATGGSLSTMARRSAAETKYQRRAEEILTDENCFKVVVVS